MNIDKNHISELIYYLHAFEGIVDKLPLTKKMYKEGNTAGQIAFHCFQAVNYWIRVIILHKEYPRNREKEFIDQPTLTQIKTSLDCAIEACTVLVKKHIPADKKITKSVSVNPAKFYLQTAGDVIMHITAHTAEHWGELHLLVDK